MKENDVVLKTVTKIVVFILLTFGFYIYLAGHNNISLITAIAPTFFGKSFLYQSEFTLHLPIFNEMHMTTVTIFELGIVLSVVGVIVTIMLALSGGKSWILFYYLS